MKRPRILLVDDHEMIRRGCRQLLEQDGFDLIDEAISGEAAWQMVQQQRPDVIVMDLSMDGAGGLDAIRRILSRHEDISVVVFSMHDDATFATRSLHAGACAYVTKISPPECLLEAVRRAATGGLYLSQDIAQKIALSGLKTNENPLSALSAREFEVFQLLVQGQNSAEIADTLSLTQKSVSNYTQRIKQKLGADSIVDLVRLAVSSGVIKQNILPSTSAR